MFIVKTFKGTRLPQWRCCDFELNRLFSSPLREPFLMASSPPPQSPANNWCVALQSLFYHSAAHAAGTWRRSNVKRHGPSKWRTLLRYHASWTLTAIPCNTRATTQLLSQLQREEEDDEASVFDQHLIYCFIQITSRVCT
jgi:hypothetical protein